jgi:hypothetical protein
MNTYQLHVDTGSSSNVETYSGQIGQASVYKQNGNPFQSTIILGNRHRAIRTAALKDAQIPVGFYNVRAPYNAITLNGTVYTVPPGNYNITSLLNALNSQITNSVGVFNTAPTTNQVSFVSNNGQVIISVLPLTLGYFLGFTNGQTAPGTNMAVTGTNSYITNFDTCFYIWIQNLGTSSLDGQQITYKIPNNTGSGSIIQYTQGSNWDQTIVVTDRSNRLDRLIVTVIDRFGNVMNNNGLDWTFTLEIESDT